jgi:hypothetical protein
MADGSTCTDQNAGQAGAYRMEHDSMGQVRVPATALWGAQTQRSYQNFPIGTETMPQGIVRAFAILKKAAAQANAQLGVLDPKAASLIERAADEVLSGGHDDQFPLKVWQTGSGTQSNMNVNEVPRKPREPDRRGGGRRAREARAPQRLGQPLAVLERHLPHGHAHRGRAGRHARAPARDRPACRHVRAAWSARTPAS